MSFNIFISYSRANDALATLIFERLRMLEDVVVYVDRNHLTGSDMDLHETLRTAIYNCDVLVALMTPEAKASWEVRQELIIAHEWWKPIVVVLPDKQVGEVPGKKQAPPLPGLPYFLRDPNWVSQQAPTLQEAGATDDLVSRLEMRIGQVKKERPQYETERKILLATRQIGETASNLGKTRGPSVQFELQNILTVTDAARKDALDQNREVNLALDTNYVVRGTPYFSTAQSIAGVSRDTSSRFWLSDDRRAIEYLKQQSGICARIFAFSNPQSAHRHRFVMAAHHKHYAPK